MTLRASLLLAMTMASGCGGDTVVVEFNFPSTDAFVRSATIELVAVSLVDQDLRACPRLVRMVEVSPLDDSLTDLSTEPRDVCELRSAAFEIPSPRSGEHAWIAAARGSSGQALLTACTVRDVFGGGEPLVMVLSPTDHYRDQFPAGTPDEACTPEDRCSRGCR